MYCVIRVYLSSTIFLSVKTSVLLNDLFLVWFGLMINVTVNNFSVMLGRSHRFLGITSTLRGGGCFCFPCKYKSLSVLVLHVLCW